MEPAGEGAGEGANDEDGLEEGMVLLPAMGERSGVEEPDGVLELVGSAMASDLAPACERSAVVSLSLEDIVTAVGSH